MSTLELKVYDIFKSKFSEQEAKQVLEFIETKADKRVEEQTQIFERIVNKDIEIAKQEIRKEIAEVKVDMVKWMFIFWASSVVATLGGLITIIKFMVTK